MKRKTFAVVESVSGFCHLKIRHPIAYTGSECRCLISDVAELQEEAGRVIYGCSNMQARLASKRKVHGRRVLANRAQLSNSDKISIELMIP